MTHLYCIIEGDLKNRPVRDKMEAVGFREREGGQTSEVDEKLCRLIFELALVKMQADNEMDRREKPGNYFYGADGVLYSNLVVYSKAYQVMGETMLKQKKRKLSTL